MKKYNSATFVLMAITALFVMSTHSQANASNRFTYKGNLQKWSATWATAPQSNVVDNDVFQFSDFFPTIVTEINNQTVRQIIRTSIGGEEVRIRLSNLEGSNTGVIINAASTGLHAGNGEITAGSLRQLTFSGSSTARIPPGGNVVSDPVSLSVGQNTDMVINLFIEAPTPANTVHGIAATTSYILAGDQTNTEQMLEPNPTTSVGWYWLAGVDVQADNSTRVIAALGDSITDGFLSTVDAHADWPAELSRRFNAEELLGPELAVLNLGIGANKVLNDRFLGQNALARFDRDILAQPGVTDLILFMGINDIIHPDLFADPEIFVTADDIIAAYVQIAQRARAANVTPFAATMTPFGNWVTFNSEAEAIRQEVNAWIRDNEVFEGFIDFDAVIRDPSDPSIIVLQYDVGDGLHPNDAGLIAMGQAIDLSLFTKDYRYFLFKYYYQFKHYYRQFLTAFYRY